MACIRRGSFASVLIVLGILGILSLAGCGSGALGSSGGGGQTGGPIVAFSAASTSVGAGQTTTLSWQTTNATSVMISPSISNQPLPLSGSASTPVLNQTTTFTLTATGPNGQMTSATVTVNVAQGAPTVTITATPATIAAGQLSTIAWTTTNAISIGITPSVLSEGQTSLPLSGSTTVSPTATTTFVATATGANGATVTAQVQVVVAAMQLNFSANPPTVTPGQSATLSWSTAGVQTLMIDNGVGNVSGQLPNGSVTVTPSASITYTATATGSGGTVTATVAITVSTPPPASGSPIKHIIFMLQENRSFDSYFGRLGAYRASRLQQMGISASPSDVDGTPANVTLRNAHTGANVSPFHYQTECTENLSPSWNESHHDVSLTGGDSAWPNTTTFTASSFGMKGFLDTTGSVTQLYDPNGTRAMGYYDQTDLPYYYELATQFATSDRWYSPVLANTIPNRMYMFTGTSFGQLRGETPPVGGWIQPTIFAALNKAGVSWRYYYQDSSVFLADFADWNDPTIKGNVYNISNWYSVLSQPTANQMLPQVIFIERGGQIGLDEHPLNNVQKGAADVQQIIAALMSSPAWADSVFILTYDEAGGLYDHVPPFQEVLPDNIAPIYQSGDIQGTFNLSGMRVPLMVMSPYVKPHLVSHTNRDHTSILKFIEKTFNVASLTARDAAADDMSEFFDFTNTALLNAPGGTPWTSFLPQQPTNGTCNQQLETGP